MNGPEGPPFDSLYCIDGQILREADACIPVTDRGFLYGDGLFETLHAYGPALFRLKAHFERLNRGTEALHFASVPGTDTLAAWLNSVIQEANFPESTVRLTVTRGSGPRGPSISAAAVPRTVIAVSRYERSEVGLQQGVRAITASIRRQESAATSSLKSLNYVEQILARREADLAGVSEALLLNNAGLLCEGSASNIALIKEGRLLIPDPQRSGALPGIAQMTAIEAAVSLGIPVLYTCLSPWDLAESQEAFLSGSMREISPLIAFDGRPIGEGTPGPVTRAIVAEFRRIIERECPPFGFPI